MNLLILTLLLASLGLILQYFFFGLFISGTDISPAQRWRTIFWGMIGATVLSSLVEGIFPAAPGGRNLDKSIVLAPLCEEFFKGVPALYLWLSGRFRGRRVLLALGALSGAGFQFFESFVYTFGASTADAVATQMLVRMGVTSFAHAFFTGLFGLGIGMASISRSFLLKPVFILGGFIAAISCHGLLNTLNEVIQSKSHQNQALGMVVLGMLFLAAFYFGLLTIALKRKKSRNQSAAIL